MKKPEKIAEILIDSYPRDEHIHYKFPFKVLVRCIISQRNRDEVTDRVASALFNKWNTPEDIAQLSVETMQTFLKDQGLGLYNNKGKWIVQAANQLIDKYNGEVPENKEALMEITGIGRKCMNIIMAYGFGNPTIPVDTHVERVSKRLGLVDKESKPQTVENTLKNQISQDKWFYINHAMVDHGKRICKPQKPLCEKCPLTKYCRYYKKKRKKK